jgi:hypothetical protein
MGFKRVLIWILVGGCGASIVAFIAKKPANEMVDSSSAPTTPPLGNEAPQKVTPPSKSFSSLLQSGEKPALQNRIPSAVEKSQGLYQPTPNLSHLPKSKRRREFSAFESLARKEISNPLPELIGWSTLPDLSLIEDSTVPTGNEKLLTFKSLRFKSGAPNPSSLQNFRAPIAVISPETKKIAIITGRLSVIHRSAIDRLQFAHDHNLKLDSAPENSRSATYYTEMNQSLVDARIDLSRDKRVLEVEIEILPEKVRK